MKTKHLEVKIDDESEGKVSAVFATFGVKDSDGDVTIPGAFVENAPVRISAFNHQSWEKALPVGKGIIRTTDQEAILEGQFFLQTTAGRETFEVVKELGSLGEWSYGFDILESEPGTHDGEPVQFLKALDVHEVSPVILGAGVNTRTLVAKRKQQRFSDHAVSVLTDVQDLNDRAAEVKAKRQEKGKSIGAESKDLLSQLEPELKRLAEILIDDEPSSAKTETDPSLEIERSRIHLRRLK